MYNYKLMIQYDGSRYKGWQRLGGDEITIQAELENALSHLLKESIEITGCSRTDAGVHALAQVANFKTDQRLEAIRVKQELNHILPEDIRIIAATIVEGSFHARYMAKEKTYLYKIWNRDYPNPFMRKYSLYVSEKLNLNMMSKAAGCFVGRHDFTAFSNAKSGKKSPLREIYEITFEEDGGFLYIRLRGDGFLYNMARWIVGTLLDIGLGKLEAELVPAMLEEKVRSRTGNLAAAYGLYLEKINY